MVSARCALNTRFTVEQKKKKNNIPYPLDVHENHGSETKHRMKRSRKHAKRFMHWGRCWQSVKLPPSNDWFHSMRAQVCAVPSVCSILFVREKDSRKITICFKLFSVSFRCSCVSVYGSKRTPAPLSHYIVFWHSGGRWCVKSVQMNLSVRP